MEQKQAKKYTKEQVIEILTKKIEWKRQNGQGFWADKQQEQLDEYLTTGKKIIVETEFDMEKGMEYNTYYYSDGTCETNCNGYWD